MKETRRGGRQGQKQKVISSSRIKGREVGGGIGMLANKEKEHRPSGLMCQVCARRDADCSKLDFAAMHRMKTDRDGVAVVKCNQFQKSIDSPGMVQSSIKNA